MPECIKLDLIETEKAIKFIKDYFEKELAKGLKKYQSKYSGKELDNKLFIYLSRRGFEYSMIKEALEERDEVDD